MTAAQMAEDMAFGGQRVTRQAYPAQRSGPPPASPLPRTVAALALHGFAFRSSPVRAAPSPAKQGMRISQRKKAKRVEAAETPTLPNPNLGEKVSEIDLGIIKVRQTPRRARALAACARGILRARRSAAQRKSSVLWRPLSRSPAPSRGVLWRFRGGLGSAPPPRAVQAARAAVEGPRACAWTGLGPVAFAARISPCLRGFAPESASPPLFPRADAARRWRAGARGLLVDLHQDHRQAPQGSDAQDVQGIQQPPQPEVAGPPHAAQAWLLGTLRAWGDGNWCFD